MVLPDTAQPALWLFLSGGCLGAALVQWTVRWKKARRPDRARQLRLAFFLLWLSAAIVFLVAGLILSPIPGATSAAVWIQTGAAVLLMGAAARFPRTAGLILVALLSWQVWFGLNAGLETRLPRQGMVAGIRFVPGADSGARVLWSMPWAGKQGAHDLPEGSQNSVLRLSLAKVADWCIFPPAGTWLRTDSTVQVLGVSTPPPSGAAWPIPFSAPLWFAVSPASLDIPLPSYDDFLVWQVLLQEDGQLNLVPAEP